MKKKLLSLLLAILMVISILPISSIIAMAQTAPIATATLRTSPKLDGYITESAPDESGWRSQPRQYALTNIKDANGKAMDDITQAYCINHGATFKNKDLTKYYGYRPADSAYFNTFSETQQMGILLVSAFGYPSVHYKDLGAKSPEEAIAATQAIIWEFNVGSRTSFEGDAKDGENPDWAYSMVKNVEGANAAYWHILASAQKWVDDGGNWKALLDDKGMIVWEQSDSDVHWEEGNAQVILSYNGDVPENPFGSISITKIDEVTKKGIEGAYFTIYDQSGKEFEVLGPTSAANNYTVRTGQTIGEDTVPYGTYRVVESKVPDGYTAIQKSWTVIVDEEHKHVELTATNRQDKKIQIVKTGDGDLIANRQFAIYDDDTDKKLLTLTTGSDGKSEVALLPYAKNYRWEEVGVGAEYTAYAYVGDKWVTASTPWTFTYDDVPVNATFLLKAKNEKLPGFVRVKKTTTDGGTLAGFHFDILNASNRNVVTSGYTNASGYLITGKQVGIIPMADYTLNDIPTISLVDYHWSDYGDVTCNYIFTASTDILYDDFISELEAWSPGTYALLVSEGSSPKIETDPNTGTLLVSGATAVVKEINGEWQTYGFLFTTVQMQSSSYLQSMIDAWDGLGKGTNISDDEYLDYFKTNDSLYLNPYYSYVDALYYDVNCDGYMNSEDLAIIKAAEEEGRDFIENPLIQLDEGKYILKETLSAEQADKYATPIEKTFTVQANGTAEVSYTNRSIASSIRIIKTSEDGIVEGFKFRITGPNNFIYEGVTDASGEIYVEKDNNGTNVGVGTYTITEYDIHGRYNSPAAQTVTVTQEDANAGATKSVTFLNTLKPLDLNIIKTSEDNVVEGIQFNIYGYNIKGEYINITATTDVNGNIVTSVYPGEYYVVEVPTADRRYLTPEIKKISPTISSTGVVSGNTVTFNNVLKKFTVELYKKSSTGLVGGEATLQGAVFGLYKNGVLVERQTTDSNGYLKFGVYICSDTDDYTVREISAPTGFYLNSTVYTVDTSPLNHDVEINTITIEAENDPIMGTVSIYKLKGTEDDSVPESGAIFHVYLKSAGSYADAADNEKDRIVTDTEDPNDPMGYFGGIATTKELPYGTYIVEQIYGDERFELAEPFEVVIDADHTSETYTVLNKPIPKPVTVTKQDVTGTKNLPGAQLKLVDEDGIEYTGTTDDDGEITFTVWPGKSYTLTELVAPEGYVLSSEAVNFTLDIYGEVVDGSTVIKNEPNRVVVKKVDDEGNPLADATFECVNATTGAVFDTKTTDSTGVAVFECLPYSNYEIRETKCPAGYKLSDDVFKFTITSEWTNQPEGGYDFQCINEDTEVKISKIDIVSQAGLPGATIEIYDANGEVYASGVTDSNGVFTIRNIVPGEYTFKEVKAPSSYELNTTVFSFTVTEEGEIVGDTIITDKPNKYVVKKVNAAGEALAGAVFEMINDETGEVFATAISGEDGLAVFESIPYGNFTIFERTPAPGYVISGEVIKVEITPEWINVGEGEFNSEYLNSPTSITFEKKDASTGEYVPGAEITVYDAEGKVYAKGTTDELGRYTIHNIIPGSYTWKETYAPAGYVLNETVFSFTITEEGEVIGDNVLSNTPVEVIISKTDVTNGAAVPGATVVVKDAEGNEIFNGLTDENGEITLEYLKPGKYTFQEISSPAGYKLNKTVFEFEVTETGEIIGITEFTNEPTEVIITKTDITGEKFLPGADIVILDENGETVFEGTTDKNGQIKLQYLIPGTYTYVEVSAPEAYSLNSKEYRFVIDTDGNITGDNTITDELMRVTVLKTNELNEPMEGVVFNVYDKNGNFVISATTDGSGQAVFEGLKWNEYTIKEVSTLDGYILANDSIKIVVDGKWINGAEGTTFTVINYPIPKTGDMSNMLWFVLLAFVSICGIAYTFRNKRFTISNF